jgi:diguanylate cyclase (GGDEF)-like protein
VLQETLFDLILLDLSLPDGFGLDSYYKLSDTFPAIPIIILTGHKNEDDAVESVQTGAQDYLIKDFSDPNLLIRSILFGIERHKHWKSIHQLSLIDELTGLQNRRGFFALSNQLLKLVKRSEHQVFVLFMDLNGMKTINDTLGHDVGDEALKQTAQILRDTFRETDVIARLGGDEFAVVAEVSNQYNKDKLLARFQSNVDAFNQKNNNPYTVSVSAGIVLVDKNNPETIEDLLKQADQLMYQDKVKKKEAK